MGWIEPDGVCFHACSVVRKQHTSVQLVTVKVKTRCLLRTFSSANHVCMHVAVKRASILLYSHLALPARRLNVRMPQYRSAPDLLALSADVFFQCQEPNNVLTALLPHGAGYLVFHGPRAMVPDFFEALGFRCPERKGEADFLQEVAPAACRLPGVWELRKACCWSFWPTCYYCMVFRYRRWGCRQRR